MDKRHVKFKGLVSGLADGASFAIASSCGLCHEVASFLLLLVAAIVFVAISVRHST